MDANSINCIECHDDLLKRWEDQLSPLNRDGIISPKDWENANLKVLFVLKEINQSDKKNGINVATSISKALDNNKSNWWKKNVLRRVGRWAYGLTNYLEEVPSFKAARSGGKKSTGNVAYINMKKSPGGAKTNMKKFDAHVREYAPYIKRQIELIKPDVVVLGGTFWPVKDHIFPELKRVCERIHLLNGTVFINAYHPAQKTISAEDLYHQVLNSYHNYKSGYAT